MDINDMRQKLHDWRHSDAKMSDWARAYGAKLCDRVELLEKRIATTLTGGQNEEGRKRC